MTPQFDQIHAARIAGHRLCCLLSLLVFLNVCVAAWTTVSRCQAILIGTYIIGNDSLATADCLQRNVEGKHLQRAVSALHKVETFIQTGCGLENLLGAAATVTPAWTEPWLQNLGLD